MTYSELKDELEKAKALLESYLETESLYSEKVLKLSQEIDELIFKILTYDETNTR